MLFLCRYKTRGYIIYYALPESNQVLEGTTCDQFIR